MKTQVNIYIILDFNDMSMSNTILQCKFHVYFLIDLRHVQQSSAHIVKQILVSIPSAEQASILGLLHEMGMKTEACPAGARKYSLKFPIPVTQILASAFKLMHASNCMILTFLNFAISVICCHMKKKLCNSKCGFNFSYM